MQTFKLTPGAAQRLQKKSALRGWVLGIYLGIIVAALIYTNYYYINTLVDVFLYFPILIGLYYTYTLLKGIRRATLLMEGYSFTLDDTSVSATFPGLRTYTLEHKDIKEIVSNPRMGIRIVGFQPGPPIVVPPSIADRPLLESELEKIHPITVKKNQADLNLLLLLLIGIGFTLAYFVYSQSITAKPLIVVSGTLLCGLLAWGTWKFAKNPVTRKRLQGMMIWMIIFVIAIVVRRLTGKF